MDEWIRVAEQVPPRGMRVLATDGTVVGEAFRGKANAWFRCPSSLPWERYLSPVTCWMPMPKPPKEEQP